MQSLKVRACYQLLGIEDLLACLPLDSNNLITNQRVLSSAQKQKANPFIDRAYNQTKAGVTKDAEAEVQKTTDNYSKIIDGLVADKESEIMTV